MNDLYDNVHNPDVLSCLANLSNDEVFTPPEIANQMLDMLPQDLFSNPDTKFLDPACKSGIFLREIAKRLIKGLEKKIPDLQARLDHIFHEQLYGIGITELTSLLSRRSLYCSKYPNSQYSVSVFDNAEGNIRYKRIQHSWKDGKCEFCGANKEQYDRSTDLETHAYEWIHTLKPEEIFNMKFDVIISNPPYQLNTAEATKQATPLYDKFVLQAKKLNPRYITMIIPSRWFAGGMGLETFRKEMLEENGISHIVDYPNAKECFSGLSIGGGVCYFLWQKDYKGSCLFTTCSRNTREVVKRKLDEFDVFVRYNVAVNVIHKVRAVTNESIMGIISSLSPFGLPSKERGYEVCKTKYLTVHSSQGKGFLPISKIPQGHEFIKKYHVMLSKVTGEHAGEPDKNGQFKILSKMQVLKPNEVCTFSYFLVGNFDSEKEAYNCYTYLSTKFARFLLQQAVTSINISREKFQFVPMQDFSKPWTDEELYKKYKLTKKEIDFIESMIKPMNLGGEENG